MNLRELVQYLVDLEALPPHEYDAKYLEAAAVREQGGSWMSYVRREAKAALPLPPETTDLQVALAKVILATKDDTQYDIVEIIDSLMSGPIAPLLARIVELETEAIQSEEELTATIAHFERQIETLRQEVTRLKTEAYSSRVLRELHDD